MRAKEIDEAPKRASGTYMAAEVSVLKHEVVSTEHLGQQRGPPVRGAGYDPFHQLPAQDMCD